MRSLLLVGLALAGVASFTAPASAQYYYAPQPPPVYYYAPQAPVVVIPAQPRWNERREWEARQERRAFRQGLRDARRDQYYEDRRYRHW